MLTFVALKLKRTSQKKLDEYLVREEELWSHKSREIWLKEGDKNTKKFIDMELISYSLVD